MRTGGNVEWVRHEALVKTYDGSFDTIEDFTFLANAAGRIRAQSRIVVGPGGFSDSRFTGSHRPVRATFTILPLTRQAELERRIRERALPAKAEFEAIDSLVRQLPE